MDIPDNKRFFRIGEVSRIIGIKTHVLRFWEKEFPEIKPKRTEAHQRAYRREDIQTIEKIKNLLYEEKLTINGTKKRLKSKDKLSSVGNDNFLHEIRDELRQILKILQ